MRKKCTSIGGQAVIEGVMMRGIRSMATAVRDEKGNVVVESQYLTPIKEKNIFYRIPIIRGFLNFISSMIVGMGTLMRSGEVFGEDIEPSKFEQWLAKKCHVNIYSVVMAIAVILGIALSLGLFFFLPHLIVSLIEKIPAIDTTKAVINILMSLLEGVIRIAIFVCYIWLTTLVPDVKRTYMYHGAEHKTISCYEHDLEMNVENARKMTTIHDRCGTAFMFIVMVISIFIFAVVNSVLKTFGIIENNAILFLIKLALIPLVSGVSYEFLKIMAKFDNILVRILKAPGLWLQKLTTKEPTDDMLEVAITAFKTVLDMDADNTIPVQKFDCNKLLKKVRTEINEKLKAVNAEECETDWILSICMNIKRSEIPTQSYIKESQYAKAMEIVEKRLTGMPLWKIIGNTDFYGVEITINEDVLAPRMETEELVEKAIGCIKEGDKVLDLCTGSGCIAIAVALYSKASKVVASDISKKAIEIAKTNVKNHNLEEKINIVESDLFENISEKFNVIISNPPYIKTDDIETLDREVKDFDPYIALNGGEDGLEFYRKIIASLDSYLEKDGYILFECGENQAREIASYLQGYEVEIIKDLQGIERIIKARVSEK